MLGEALATIPLVVDTLGDWVAEDAGAGTDSVNAWLSWALGANVEQPG